MSINFEWYKVFYQVAKEKQISRAAKKLFISQPAVSQNIKQLEEKLGGPLFHRTPRGMTLTKEGQVLYAYVEKAHDLLVAGQSKFDQMVNLNHGQLLIATSDTLCSQYLLPYIESYHKTYPDIKLTLSNGTSYETLALVKDGLVDLGIVHLPLKDTQGLEVMPIKDIQDCFAYNPQALDLATGPYDFEDLARLPLISLEPKASSRQFLDRVFKEEGHLLCPEIEVESLDLVGQLASIGLGVACTTQDLIHLHQDQLVLINLRAPLPPRHIGLIYKKSTPLSMAAQPFVNILQTDLDS